MNEKPGTPAQRKLSDALDEEVRNVRTEKVPQRLWHYTNAVGMHGVLTSKLMRCPHYQHMNDPQELSRTQGIAVDLLKKLRPEYGKYAQEAIDAAIGWMTIDLGNDAATGGDAFLACFSTERDDLGQWIAYGDRCRGYALGLELRPLSGGRPETPNVDVQVCSVIYNEVQFREKCETALRRVLALLPDRAPKGDGLLSAIIAHDAISSVVGGFRARYKDQAFRNEREWRIVAHLNHEDAAPCFHTNRGLVPYVDVGLALSGYLPVRELMIGSALEHEPARTSVRLLLQSLGYFNPPIDLPDPTVSRSEIGFRP